MLEVAVETVNSVTSLLMPTAGSFELVGSGELRLLVTPAPSSGFVRISVVSDDEGESDAEEGEEEEDAVAAANGSAGGVYSRVAIVEDSESDEEEEEAADVQSADARKVASADELKDRGNALLKANEVRDAVQAYTDSLAIDPKFVPALNNRAQAYLVLKVGTLRTLA
jgi:tetratricopeptide (TPR) repeat protein